MASTHAVMHVHDYLFHASPYNLIIREIPKYFSLKWSYFTHLINKLSFVFILITQHVRPQIRISSLHEVSGLTLEQGVFITNIDQFVVAKTSFVGDASQVGISLFTVFSHDFTVIMLVLPEKYN